MAGRMGEYLTLLEEGVPPHIANEMIAVAEGGGCTHDEAPDLDAPVVEADELAELGDLPDDL